MTILAIPEINNTLFLSINTSSQNIFYNYIFLNIVSFFILKLLILDKFNVFNYQNKEDLQKILIKVIKNILNNFKNCKKNEKPEREKGKD